MYATGNGGQTTTTYNGLTTTVTAPNGTQQTMLNSSGLVATSVVNGKSVSYTYYPDGQAKSITPQNGKTLSFTYNKQGKQYTLNDPDLGLITTVYNGFGELTSESRMIHNNQGAINTTYIYQPATGLLDTKICGSKVTSYYYDNLKRLSSVDYDEQYVQSYEYGNYDRITKITDYITENSFEKTIRYDAYGRVVGYTFPSGYSVTNKYDVCGNLTEVTDNSDRPVWKAMEANARGQLTKEKKNTVETTYSYDDTKGGLLTSISAPGIINYTYTYDAKLNPYTRTDVLTNQKETFVYDELNRLTNWNITNATTGSVIKNNSVTYQGTTGNIGTKTNIQNDQSITLSYDEAVHPHRLWTVEGVSDQIPTGEMSITYTDFNKVASIVEANKNYTVTYGANNQRCKSEYKINNVTQLTRYYSGNYEEEHDNVGNIRKIHYLSGGAVLINTNGIETLYYGYTDNQGSLVALTDINCNVVEKYAYDPWGARRNPDNWSQKDSRTSFILNRGYTGHEHLDMFGAINMNGRVYDPVTAQFFSPDPFVQSAGNWANYNRYSYGLNNPMIYTDPSGYRHKTAQELEQEAADSDYLPGPYWEGRYHFVGGSGGGPTGWHPAGSGSGTTLWDIINPMLGGNWHWENGKYSTIDRVYFHKTEIGGYYGGVYIDGFKLNGKLYEFDLPMKYGESGNFGTNDWLQTVNDISGVVTTLITGGVEGVNAYIRNQFKSATSWTGWTKLRSTQQTWRAANILGKTGAVTLSAIGKFGGVLGGLSAGYSVNQVINQYNGEIKSVDPWVVGDAIAGIAGTTSFVAIATGFAVTNPLGWALVGVGASAYGAYRVGEYIYKEFIK